MASRNYSVGLDPNNINLKVKTGTASTCYSIAFQRLVGGQKIDKAESTATNNGAIANTTIGLASNLKNSKLIIQTMADFSVLPPEVREAIKSDPHALKINLLIEYAFSGGFSGDQTFDYDYDDYIISTDGSLVTIVKEVDFI